jgi:hypothetical protein
MQTDCYCLNWAVTEKYRDAESLDEFLTESEGASEYTRSIPGRIWCSDSTSQYHYVSEALVRLATHVPPEMRAPLDIASSCIAWPIYIEELGLTELPDTCNFASISPTRVRALAEAFKSLDFSALGVLHARTRSAEAAGKWPDVQQGFVSYLDQWRDALAFAAEHKYGLIGARG